MAHSSGKFFYHMNKNKIPFEKNLYDIGLVSDPLSSHDEQFNLNTLEEGLPQQLNIRLNCIKNNMKMILPGKEINKKKLKHLVMNGIFIKDI